MEKSGDDVVRGRPSNVRNTTVCGVHNCSAVLYLVMTRVKLLIDVFFLLFSHLFFLFVFFLTAAAWLAAKLWKFNLVFM